MGCPSCGAEKFPVGRATVLRPLRRGSAFVASPVAPRPFMTSLSRRAMLEANASRRPSGRRRKDDLA
jgi:hypothetical protein